MCPRCKQRETFFIDAWDTMKAMAFVKSFERGHTEEAADTSQALRDARIIFNVLSDT